MSENLADENSGIWLEIANVRHEIRNTAGEGGGDIVQIQFKHDRADREPAWWPLSGCDSKELRREYDRLIRALDGKQTVLGRLGIESTTKTLEESTPKTLEESTTKTLEVVTVRIQFSDSSVR